MTTMEWWDVDIPWHRIPNSWSLILKGSCTRTFQVDMYTLFTLLNTYIPFYWPFALIWANRNGWPGVKNQVTHYWHIYPPQLTINKPPKRPTSYWPYCKNHSGCDCAAVDGVKTLVSHLLQRPVFRHSKLSNVTDKTAIKYADRKNTNTPTLEYFVNFAYLKCLRTLQLFQR